MVYYMENKELYGTLLISLMVLPVMQATPVMQPLLVTLSPQSKGVP